MPSPVDRDRPRWQCRDYQHRVRSYISARCAAWLERVPASAATEQWQLIIICAWHRFSSPDSKPISARSGVTLRGRLPSGPFTDRPRSGRHVQIPQFAATAATSKLRGEPVGIGRRLAGSNFEAGLCPDASRCQVGGEEMASSAGTFRPGYFDSPGSPAATLYPEDAHRQSATFHRQIHQLAARKACHQL